MVNVIYRLSDNGYNKVKYPHATKLHCLENCLKHFDANTVYMFVDNTNLVTKTRNDVDYINESEFFGNLEYYTAGSSAASFRHVFDFALDNFKDDDIVYFVEDDYLHKTHSAKLIVEGLQIANYVSLYDHNDKYIPASHGGNPFIEDDGGEITKVYKTKSTHWKLTNSTTMTFACTIRQLLTDFAIWRKHTEGSHPNDFQCFLELRDNGRSLITTLPGYSTHCEPQWASPLTDWNLI
jgi:hypothetical protein